VSVIALESRLWFAESVGFHIATNDHSRIVYVEAHSDEMGQTCAEFITRAVAWFTSHGVTIERVMTDNARNYRTSRAFQQALSNADIRHLRTRPYRPQINGKTARFNQPSSTNGPTTSP
jgi:transposase